MTIECASAGASSGISRRRLLQTLGSLALLPALPGAAAGAVLAAQPLPPLKLGVVLPEGTRLPGLAQHFSDGLSLALAGQPVTLYPRSYPAGSTRAVTEAIQQLAADSTREGIELAAGLIDPRIVSQVSPALAEAGLPLLGCDSGANVADSHPGGVEPGLEEAGFISRLSLDYWQSFYQAGHWAAPHLGRRAVLAIGWRDSGYDLPYAFEHAFCEAGGEVLARQVSFPNGDSRPFAELQLQLDRHRPDFVCAMFSGEEAEQFATWWPRSGYAAHVPLLAGGLAAPLQALSAAQATVLTAASWADAAFQCSAFGQQCQAAGLRPGPYRLLGYEAGLRLLGTWAQGARDGLGGQALAEAMRQAVIVSPRGQLQPVGSGSGGTHWLLQGNELLTSLPHTPVAEKFLAAVHSPLRSGWSMPYLSA